MADLGEEIEIVEIPDPAVIPQEAPANEPEKVPA